MMQKIACTTLFLCSFAILAACSDTVEVGSSVPGTDAGMDIAPEPDTSDDATREDEDAAAVGCSDDEECGGGTICEGAECIEGCRTNEDCADPERTQVCHENRCVGCRDDLDCSLEFVCESDLCVEGCRGDDGCRDGRICGEGDACEDGCREDVDCGEGLICTNSQCLEGCRDDAHCPLGSVCDNDQCVTGCTSDERCDRGTICEGGTCNDGCRNNDGCDRGTICRELVCVGGCAVDDDCAPDEICTGEACIIRGVGCRTDEDCRDSDECDQDIQRCEPSDEPCTDDDFEPNDSEENAAVLAEGTWSATWCGDLDWFTVDLGEGDELRLRVDFNPDIGPIDVVLRFEDDNITRAQRTENGSELNYTTLASGAYTLLVSATARQTYGLSLTIVPAMMCVETLVYRDSDDDGFGDDDDNRLECLEEDEGVPGYVRDGGDCGPNDALRFPGAEGICGDRVDDNCDGRDENCPESRDGMHVPEWDCQGDPPASVYAYARFDDGGGYFRNGGCFFFFEGFPGEFYSRRALERDVPPEDEARCDSFAGCTCPSLNGWPSYDNRLYAFTLAGDAEECPDIWLQDHGRQDDVLMVSNDCRKYLYQLHQHSVEYSYLTGNIENLQQRLTLYPQVEVACVEDRPHRNLPYQSLLVTDIVLNENFEGM
jgi:hypothetical protein